MTKTVFSPSASSSFICNRIYSSTRKVRPFESEVVSEEDDEVAAPEIESLFY